MNEPRSRPILFSAPMVRAILAGTKTQTRRVVKMPEGFDFTAGQNDDPNDPTNWGAEDEGGAWWALADGPDVDRVLPCKYGQPGDLLWVRETFYCDDFRYPSGPPDEMRRALHYRATDCLPDGKTLPGFAGESFAPPWRPSIHMPRWASRITLEVTGVRVERLQAISDEDARAEGVQWDACPTKPDPEYLERRALADRLGMGTHLSELIDYVGGFRRLWESINGPGSLDANPWVWVVEFKPIKAAK